MEFINDFEQNTNQYAKKINESKYIEGRGKTEEKGKSDICEIIIGANEIDYISYGGPQKSAFINQKKLEIASSVIGHEKYSKEFSQSLIQNGFQSKNVFSSILYLNEYYKINSIIYNQDTNEYYKTSFKNYEPLFCIYKNNEWFTTNESMMSENVEFSDSSKLSTILTMDMKSNIIYQSKLKSISKYKVSELESIATEYGIEIKTETGKKKLKKQLFNEINLKHYTQDI